MCGDGIVDSQEACDWANPNDNTTCGDLNLGNFMEPLSCKSDCTYDTSGCSSGGAGGAAGQGGAGQGGGGGCIPKTCEQLNKNCGSVPDGCGNFLNCQYKDCSAPGSCNAEGCPNDLSCGAGTVDDNVCGCNPGEYECLWGNLLRRCNKEGSRFITQALCSGATCDPLAGKCGTYFPGKHCDGDILVETNGPTLDCSLSGNICDGSDQICRKCIPDSYICQGTNLFFCSKIGIDEFVKDCGTVEKCHLGARLGGCPVP